MAGKPPNSVDSRAIPVVSEGPERLRRTDLDVAKGIGIICVVVGHLTPYAYQAIYLFHMPLFFVLAGMMSSHSPKAKLKEKLERLGRPYLSFLLLIWVIPAILQLAAGKATSSDFFLDMVRAAWGGELLFGSAAVFWFPGAYAGMIIFAALFCGNTRTFSPILAIAIVAVAYVLSYAFPSLHFPLALNVAPIAFVYYLFGRHLLRAKFAQKSPIYVGTAIAGAVGAIGVAKGWFPTLSLKYADYGMPIVTVIASLASAAAIILLAELIARTALAPVLSLLGRASLFIMYTHMIVAEPLLAPFDLSDVVQVGLALGICILSFLVIEKSVFLNFWLLGQNKAVARRN